MLAFKNIIQMVEIGTATGIKGIWALQDGQLYEKFVFLWQKNVLGLKKLTDQAWIDDCRSLTWGQKLSAKRKHVYHLEL